MSTCRTLAGILFKARRVHSTILDPFQPFAGIGLFGLQQAAQGLPFVIGAAVARRGAEADRLVPSIPPQEIDRLMGGNRIEPGSEAAARRKLPAFQMHLQERGLEGVLGQLSVAQALAQVAVEFPLIAVDKFLERVAVARLGVCRQQLLIRPHGRTSVHPLAVWFSPRSRSA